MREVLEKHMWADLGARDFLVMMSRIAEAQKDAERVCVVQHCAIDIDVSLKR